MLSLLALAVVVAGFAFRLNPLFVVAAAGLCAGLAAGLGPAAAVAALGHAFNQNRFVSAAWLVLPVIGVLERRGLQTRAGELIRQIRSANAGRLLTLYLVLRQLTAALGLTGLGGQAVMVRPLIAPMATAAADNGLQPLAEEEREVVRAHAAAVDNIGAFFGEDVFIAFGSLLLIRGVLQGQGVTVSLLRLSLWAMPTALAAFLVHAARLAGLDGRLRRRRARREARGPAS